MMRTDDCLAVRATQLTSERAEERTSDSESEDLWQQRRQLPRPRPRAEAFCSKTTTWTTSSPRKTLTKISRWSRSWPKSSRPTKCLPNAEKMEHKEWEVTRAAAAESRGDGPDQRRHARRIRRLGDGQGLVGHHRRLHGEVRQLHGDHGRPQRHRHAAHRLLRHRRAEEEVSAQARHRRNRSAPTRCRKAPAAPTR